jgi:hypothetical protein
MREKIGSFTTRKEAQRIQTENARKEAIGNLLKKSTSKEHFDYYNF